MTAIAVPAPSPSQALASEPPTPVRVIGASTDRYAFVNAEGRVYRLTLMQLCDRATLVDLCCGDAWLSHYFPEFLGIVIDGEFRRSSVRIGINTLVAAHFLADLAIEEEERTHREALRKHLMRPWWTDVLDWLCGTRSTGAGR